MKLLNKISLVYTLQIFAVILLFSYTGSSAENETKDEATDGIEHLGFYKQSLPKTNKDSLLAKNIDVIWNINTTKSW